MIEIVTQADRDAAAEFADAEARLWNMGDSSLHSGPMRRGERDDTLTVQAFARHRIEAQRSPDTSPPIGEEGAAVTGLEANLTATDLGLGSGSSGSACFVQPSPSKDRLRRPDASPDSEIGELIERLRAPDFWHAVFHGKGRLSECEQAAPFEAAAALTALQGRVERLEGALREIEGFSDENGMTRRRMRKIARAALSTVVDGKD